MSDDDKKKVSIKDLPVPLKELDKEEQEDVTGGTLNQGSPTLNPTSPTLNPTSPTLNPTSPTLNPGRLRNP